MKPVLPGGISHRILDCVPVFLTLPESDPRQVEFREYDASSFVLYVSSLAFPGTPCLEPGGEASLKLRIPGHGFTECPCRIRASRPHEGGILLTLDREDFRPPQLPGPEAMAAHRS